MSIYSALQRELKTLAEPERAAQQQAYMKSEMPYLGIQAAELRRTAKHVFRDHPLATQVEWHDEIAKLWRTARFREYRYASIELMAVPRYKKAWLDLSTLPLIREMIETGAWWDYVDVLAVHHVGALLKSEPASMYKTLRTWSHDPHLWIRRTAILAQLKFATEVNVEFLEYAIEGSIEDKDFFARKAIGWVLREYSRTDPDYVIDYVTSNKSRLSGLSKREALRLVIKRGLIDQIP
jgi:3-methyladenine DNA glycosylase AlkD